MDAPDDTQELLLQRTYADRLSDFERSLGPFLSKTTSSGHTRQRRLVRARETERLVNLLEPFQEQPQLLDAYLSKLIPVLANAFLLYLQTPLPNHQATHTNLLMPLSKAICRLLYTFCKIRGEKVIVRFFSTETKYLELLLSAIETGSPKEDGQSATTDTWDWEERYVALLWLSQLLLAPFDLSSISSGATLDRLSNIPGLAWPENIPGVAQRVIPLSIRYLSSAGKERDAAKVLLVRVAMRTDMQALGILRALVLWALSNLQPSVVVQPAYHYIGILSLLAGILVSSVGTTDMDQFYPTILDTIKTVSNSNETPFESIRAPAVARKTIGKILRTITIIDLRHESPDEDALMEIIGAFMDDYLKDPATPVRIAASKALSMITLNMPTEWAEEVVDQVLISLRESSQFGSGKNKTFSLADPLRWHGLILALAQLLHRRSPPYQSLPDILNYLILGLSFEQRSTSGSSIGTNVRDSACIGIWYLARNYTTTELKFSIKNIEYLNKGPRADATTRLGSQPLEIAALQGLATELVVAACLDPAGNIRRAASAALQELVGRHPDTIENGIQLVQIVDYHGVALRSKAMLGVAIEAAQSSEYCHHALKIGLLGWRGARDREPSIRRLAAIALGNLLRTKLNSSMIRNPYNEIENMIEWISERSCNLGPYDTDEVHGLLLCFASIVTHMRPHLRSDYMKREISEIQNTGLKHIVELITERAVSILTLIDRYSTEYVRPELIGEGTSCLISAIFPVLRASVFFRWIEHHYQQLNETDKPQKPVLPDIDRLSGEDKFAADLLDTPSLEPPSSFNYSDTIRYTQVMWNSQFTPDKTLLDLMENLLTKFLQIEDSVCVEAVSTAASDLLLLFDSEKRQLAIHSTIDSIMSQTRDTRAGSRNQSLRILFKTFPITIDSPVNSPDLQSAVLKAIYWKWAVDSSIETRATLLRCLAKSSALVTHVVEFSELISTGLDDYTTDARGDIGSIVRIEAVRATGSLWQHGPNMSLPMKNASNKLFGQVLRLAAEKLDKIRVEAQKSLSLALGRSGLTFSQLLPTSPQYFRSILGQIPPFWAEIAPYNDRWMIYLFEGYVISADVGSEDLVRASRTALIQFCEDPEENSHGDNLNRVCQILLQVLKENLSNDRVLVPTLEVVAFLFSMQVIQKSSINWRSLYILVQKAHFQTTNIRKLEAAIKVYGGLVEVHPAALQKLTSMLLHRFPKIRNQVAEELFIARGVGKGFNWMKAKKGDLILLRKELGIDTTADA